VFLPAVKQVIKEENIGHAVQVLKDNFIVSAKARSFAGDDKTIGFLLGAFRCTICSNISIFSRPNLNPQ
jgi:hypothetical protein